MLLRARPQGCQPRTLPLGRRRRRRQTQAQRLGHPVQVSWATSLSCSPEHVALGCLKY